PTRRAHGPQKVRVLFVDDSPEDVFILLRQLSRAAYDITHKRVETVRDFTAAITNEPWDLVLCDYSLIVLPPATVVSQTQGLELDLPVVVVSGLATEAVALDVMRAGACDFVSKDRLERLNPIVDRELKASALRRASEQEKRRFVARLHEAAKMESIGQLAAGVAHEINTPMQFIRDNLEFLESASAPLLAALDVCEKLREEDVLEA